MNKVYPAIFELDPVGYGIYFPDVEGAVTQGATVPEGLTMAADALGIMLADLIANEETLPEPTPINEIDYDKETQFVTLVAVNLADYLKEAKLDKKNVSIPHWLNVRAEKAGVNFSKTLTEALMEKLNV
ncbi:type II toxin-antitoxin system HicB family antitoxin [Enterococcus sp. 669A]|uniref:Type II toxin-antitoxin system HicB family antitoxin n=1 Tax=Candidatus Enterococcus moelleringii TaxID=2815325 RepID=A0ABS3LFM3_9ENTE|nr:type II toxin-antitoxin system HicB family antitoxin [Enterococcus sp. 669A]MBO1307174.1 type II toxin-antitoxin system HicB family antitoxin [Enterococcus sp. 669A]